MIEVWPALLTAGVAFAVPQFLISNYPRTLARRVGASVVSIFALIGLLLIWKPRRIWGHDGPAEGARSPRRLTAMGTPRSSRPGCRGSS